MALLFRRPPLTYNISPSSWTFSSAGSQSFILSAIGSTTITETLTFNIAGSGASYLSYSLPTPISIVGGSTQNFTVNYNGSAPFTTTATVQVNGSGGNSASIPITITVVTPAPSPPPSPAPSPPPSPAPSPGFPPSPSPGFGP